ncbi:MAG: polysaccharide deacetylase family protein, partial [Chloroflexota bacterium]
SRISYPASRIPMTKRILLTLLLGILLASCAAPVEPPPTFDGNAAMTQAFATVNAAGTGTALALLPTETPVPSATPTYSGPPPELPPLFQAQGLATGVTPKTYVADACQYLKAKWDPNNAAPGTIVMIVMFHTIEKATETASNPMHVGSGDFKRLMKNLHDFGFQAINTNQLADFLDSNAKIPQRSVVLIQDDRHAAENYNDWWRPYWEQWGWQVVNGWIAVDGGNDINLADNVALEKEGLVDHQAHGVIHNINMTDASPEDFIRSELQGSIDALQQYFGKTPVGIIWPGGGFGVRPVAIARELGYRVGFTVNPRGPVMYNWVPQADAPTTPTDIAEGPVGDPRMTLPRYWPGQVIPNLDIVRVISEQAIAYAEQNKSTELLYYNVVCAPTLGPLP